jgi:putative ABC transport system substrate-binding protein
LGETGDGAGLDHGAAIYGTAVEALRHLFLPERVFSGGDFAAAVPARQEAMTSCAFAPALDSTSTRFAKEATSKIPIVMAQDPDPVGTGFVASLARPGGNITGLSNLRSDLGGKRLEILRDTIPGLARVAIIGTSTTPGNAQALADVERAASTLALGIQLLEVLGPQDIETAFKAAIDGHAGAVLVMASHYLLSNRALVADIAIKGRIPTMYYTSDYVRDGGLMSYGVSITDLFRRAATYVGRIAKGAYPGDLPVEQPTKFELIINLRAAKAIGLSIPHNVFERADEVTD